jgi:acyl carrier protein
MDDIEIKIREFLSKFFKDYELKSDENIFTLGFVNSLFAMQLVMFIESKFSITIESDDLDLKNFRTINAMVALVQLKSKVTMDS